MITKAMEMDVRAWTDETLEALDCDFKVKIEFNSRFTARMGDASYNTPVGPRIRLSAPMWPLISQVQRRETVIHEVCHLAVMHDALKAGKRFSHHGQEWKAKMWRCGIEPNVNHDFDTSKLKNSRKKAKLYCGCPEPHMVTPQKRRKVAEGKKFYRCRDCRMRLTTEPTQIPTTHPKPKPAHQRILESIRKAVQK